MHCDSTELFLDQFTFSRVNSSANVNTKLPNRAYNCLSAANRARRTVKCGQKSIARCIDLATSMSSELIPDE
jgi:hypothetical protein